MCVCVCAYDNNSLRRFGLQLTNQTLPAETVVCTVVVLVVVEEGKQRLWLSRNAAFSLSIRYP